MENRELKLCPFCGGEAELITRKQCCADSYTVRCKNKGCRGRSQKLVRAEYEAIKTWNRRAENGKS
jgi:Lar family restriction alleviation protein